MGVRDDSRNSLIVGRMLGDKLPRMHFKKREDVKICVLKSAGHSKENIKKIAEEIKKELGNNYTYRMVGFTIFLKKWRKPRYK